MTSRRTAGAIGLAATSLFAAGLLATAGPALAPAGSPLGAPAAHADELPRFDGCEQLRRWYVDAALASVGPWGFGLGGPVVYLDGVHAPQPGGAVPLAGTAPEARAAGSTPGDTVGSSASGTNVQEPGVDEPDTAKTDGRIVVRTLGRSVVVTDVTGAQPRELSRVTVPGPRLQGPELLLAGDTLLVVGDEPRYWGGPVPARSVPRTDRIMMPTGQQSSVAHLVRIDVSDPTAPRVTADQRLDGGIVSARAYGDGTVRVVLTTGFPPLDFVYPDRERTRSEARRENRQIVRRATIDQWLPGIRTPGGPRRALLGCHDVRHPRQASGFGTISVLTFPAADPVSYSTTAVTSAGDLVYSSAERLYVATGGGRGTHVHAFALEPGTTPYQGSGVVPGTVRDRWSFSEHDGHLRVATALGSPWDPRENAVVVLDSALRAVGRIDGLGRGERIQSVRWFDDLVVVVTFRQSDPLYTLDLTSPAHPRLLGALKIPGFSSYLHPLGNDLLLGIGQDATASGTNLGAQAAVFDLHDLRQVRRTGILSLGPGTDSSAGWDPRAFTYLPSQRVALVLVSRWSEGASTVVAVRVGTDGSLRRLGSWRIQAADGNGVRMLPIGGDRVALVDRAIRLLHVG
jgi:hypothetical protein